MPAQHDCCKRGAQQKLSLSVLAFPHHGWWLEMTSVQRLHGGDPLHTGSGHTQCTLGCVVLQHIGPIPLLLWANKNPFSFWTQALRYGAAFLSGLVGLGILPWETASFLKPGVCSCVEVTEVL